jgi:hypothetical protein
VGRHSLEHFLREAERCVPHLAPEERRKWAEECHAQHPGVTEEHKTGARPLPDGRGSVEDASGGRTLVRAGLESRSGSEAEASRGLKPAIQGSSEDRNAMGEPVGGSRSAAWRWAGLALLLACAAREARCQDPAGFNGGLDPAFRNVPLVWVVNAPNGACSGVEIRYAFSASPPALYGCNQGTWTDLTAGGGGGGSGTVTSVATNNGLTGGTITTSGTLGLASIAAGGMLCNTGTTAQPPTIGNCGISVPQSGTGTVAISASSPLSLNATTGNLTCGSCLTSAVTSLNSLTGALTLVAGSNVTITTSGGNITIAAGSSGGSCSYGVNGCPNILASIQQTNQTSSIGSTTLLSSGSVGAGFYRFEGYLMVYSTCSSGNGNVYLSLSYTDPSQAETLLSGTLTLAAAGGPVPIHFSFWSAASDAISYSTTLSSCTSGAYSLYGTLERLI